MLKFKKYCLIAIVLFAVGTLESPVTRAQIGPNRPPLLVYPNPQQVLLGHTLSVKPKLGLSDNTGVASVSVSSITPQTFTGNVTVNPSGIVTISNPGTVGTFVIAIRAVDTQGSITIARFRLKVRTLECMYYTTMPNHPLTGVHANKRGPVVGDFNNDGKIDLVILEEQAHGFSILLGDGAGNFATPQNSFIATPKSVVQGEPGDFNRDGSLDLALRSPWGVIIANGNGAGGFTVSTDIALPHTETKDMTIGDFNNDGRPDVAFTYALNNDRKLYVYLNRPVLGWGLAPGSPKSFTNFPRRLESSDFNNDGKLDMAVQFEETVFTFLGDGTGAFITNLQMQFPITPGILVQMVAADFNHDGNDDLALTSEQQSQGTGTLEIHLGLGTGAFTSGQIMPNAGEGRIGLIAPDLNSDGSRDLLAGISNGTPFSEYLNDGYGFFQLDIGGFGPYTPFGGSTPAIEDFNGDGETDVVSVNYEGAIAIMLHSACAPTFSPATIEVARCEAATVKTLGSVVSDDFSPQQLTLSTNSFFQFLSITNLAFSGNNVVGQVDATANAPLGSFNYWIMVTNPNNQWMQRPVTVNVVDCPAPPLNIIQPPNINTSNSPGSCGAVVNYATPQTTGGTGSVSVVCTPASGSTFPVGSTTVNCTATDQSGVQASTSFQVNVSDTQAPQFVGLANITVDAAAGECSAPVTFNLNATDNCAGVNVVTSPASGSVFPAGTTQVTATATDASGNVTTATFNVTVNGSGPTLTNPVAGPNSLGPPDHTMRTVEVAYTATAGCGGATTCVLSVTSNEPVNSGEGGDLGPDWELVNAQKVRLRAERLASGTGRIYTITVTCTDAGGNQIIKTTTVTVPL